MNPKACVPQHSLGWNVIAYGDRDVARVRTIRIQAAVIGWECAYLFQNKNCNLGSRILLDLPGFDKYECGIMVVFAFV